MTRTPTCDFEHLPDVVATAARGCAVVAFDVFDTLLARHVAPDDVKELCAREFAARLGNPTAARRLYEVRRELEVALCGDAVQAGHDAEFRHADLMQRWTQTAASRKTLGGELAAYELVCERAATTPTPSALAAIAAARSAGARVVWVSDNYLPAAAIDGLLAAHGLRAWLHGGYVSATDLHTKRSGRLFVDLLTQENIGPHQLLVVGDTRQADRDPAVRLGARTVWVHDREAVARRRRLDVAHALVRRNAFFVGHRLATVATYRANRRPRRTKPSPHRGLGHLLGAAFTAFALFVHEKARDLGLRRVFFLSREGATFLRLYRRIGRALGERGAPAAYLCASRRATFLPSLRRLDVEELSARLWHSYPRQSIRQLLADLSLPADLAARAPKHGIGDADAPIDAPAIDARVAAFLADPQVQAAYRSAHAAARTRLHAYLDAKGIGDAGRCGMVDVGWKGSIQTHLVRALDRAEPEVEGLYLALAAGDDDSQTSRKRGYLLDHRRDGPDARPLLENSQVFEMFASAPHGAVVGYGVRRARARPILAPEPKVDHRVARQVRQGIEEAASTLLGAISALRPTADDLRPWLLDRIHRYVRYPTLAEARAVLRYEHSESFGTEATTRYGFAGEWGRILFGGALWRIPARFAAAFAGQEWPSAALRRSHVPGACFLYDRYRSGDES